MSTTTRSRQPTANQSSPEESPRPAAYLEIQPQSGGRKRKYDVVPWSPHDGFLTLRLSGGKKSERADSGQSANHSVVTSSTSSAEPFISLRKLSGKQQEFTKESTAILAVEAQKLDPKDNNHNKAANTTTKQSEQQHSPPTVSKDQAPHQPHPQQQSLHERVQDGSAIPPERTRSEDNLGSVENLIKVLDLTERPASVGPNFSPITPGFSPVCPAYSPVTPPEARPQQSAQVNPQEPQTKSDIQERSAEAATQTLVNSQTAHSELAFEVVVTHKADFNQIKAEVVIEQSKQSDYSTSVSEHHRLPSVSPEPPAFELPGSGPVSPSRGKSSTPRPQTKRKASVSPQPNSPPKRQTRQSVRDQSKTSDVANCFITLRVQRGFDPAAMPPGTTSATNSLKDIIQNLYDIQSQTYGFRPETQPVLINKIEELTQSLAKLQDLADPTINPNSNLQDLYLAPEIIDYVDDGRNPDIYGRDFIEAVQRGNAVVNGKKQAFKDFSVIYAQKLKEGIGGVGKQVDMVMEHAGMEEELRKAEAGKEQQKKENGADGKDGTK